MSHDELTLNTYDLPGGGHIDLVSRPAIERVHTLYRDCARPDLDPKVAGELGEDLLAWSIAHGFMPMPKVQAARWSLPDPDVFAVLLERVLIGEAPTVENFDRYASAYREACKIAAALPEVLGLLEEWNQPEGCGPECSEMHTFAGRCELGARAEEVSRAIVDERPDLVGRAQPSGVPFCAGRAANAHERGAMRLGPDGWVCPTCGETAEAHPDRPKVDDLDLVLDTIERFEANAETWDGRVSEAMRRLRRAVTLATLNRPLHVVPEDPLGRDGDPVEDEDGAPLPLAVQVLIRTAQDLIVEREAPSGSVSHLAERMTDLRVALDTVLAESRR